MDAHERTFIVAFEGGTGGAMGFITHDQIKLRQPLLLRLMDHIDGVIGTEDHGHVILVLTRLYAQSQPLGIGSGWVTQLMGEGLHRIILLAALLLAHIAV